MQIEQIEELQLGPRTKLRPRDRIRVSAGKKHGPENPALAVRGEFTVVRLFVKRQRGRRPRFYVDAWDEKRGQIYPVFVKGPRHRSTVISRSHIRPYKVRKLRRGTAC